MRELSKIEYNFALSVVKKYLHDWLLINHLTGFMGFHQYFDWNFSSISTINHEMLNSLLEFLDPSNGRYLPGRGFIGDAICTISCNEINEPDGDLTRRSILALKLLRGQLNDPTFLKNRKENGENTP